ncbi:MAG TPA: hypothetical protein DF364_05500 [Ruminococcaceae bacterium]|nr:hypothetical protein [Oscillospiraceae bacterium]
MRGWQVPCIQTGTGICHIYVDKAADLAMALDIIENAKTRLPKLRILRVSLSFVFVLCQSIFPTKR